MISLGNIHPLTPRQQAEIRQQQIEATAKKYQRQIAEVIKIQVFSEEKNTFLNFQEVIPGQYPPSLTSRQQGEVREDPEIQ